MELATWMRPAAVIAGPAAVVAFALLVIGLVAEGEAGLDTSPLAVASSSLLLVALFGIGAAALAALGRLRDAGRGSAGAVVALVGTVLVAGGGWASLFVLPALAADHPDVLETGLGSVVVGFIASYVVFTAGWIWTGIELIRARLVPTWLGVLVAASGVVAFVPAPEAFRLLLIGVAATLVARRLAAPAPVPSPAHSSVPA
jgi:hypothetical protein